MRIWTLEPIASFSGGTAVARIEQAIRSVMLRVHFTAGAMPITVSGVPKKVGDVFPNTTVTAYVIMKDGGQRQICTKLPLAALFEFAQDQEGVIVYNPIASTVNAAWVEGSILTSPAGALEMKDDEILHLEINGIDTEVVSHLTAYGIELPERDFRVYQYSNLSVAQDQVERTFDCEELESLIIPNNTALSELLITYSNGVTCRYVLDELKRIAFDNNDLTVAYTSTTNVAPIGQHGFSSYIILNLSKASECKVVTNGSGLTLHGVKSVAVVAPSKVVNANEKLQDTTEGKLLKDVQQLEQKAG